MRAALIVLGLYVVGSFAPFGMTHTLGPGCYWRTEPPWGFLGMSRDGPSFADRRDQILCFRGRGLKSDQPFVYKFLSRWPSEARLAHMEAHRDRPFSALGASALQLPADRRR